MPFIVNYVVVTRPQPPTAAPQIPVKAPALMPVKVAPVQPHVQPIAPQYHNEELEEFYTSVPAGPIYDDYGVMELYNPFGILSAIFSSLFWTIILAIFANLVLFGFIFFILSLRKKECQCPNCKKIIKYRRKKPLRCEFCGTRLDTIMQAH